MPLSLEKRKRLHFELSSEIARMPDYRLLELFEAEAPTNGWGHSHVMEVAGHKVFVKRIPLTELEYENQFSTRNLYDIPTYYNYGIGSAGFGAFRELMANIKATNWVLSGETEAFPLLHYHRICRRKPPSEPPNRAESDRYVEYWGGNDGIRRYMADRATAAHEMVLFLEYIPEVYAPWLPAHSSKCSETIGQLIETVHFMRRKGMVHFDAHFHNILTDGKRVYLTDFGLVLDKSFELSSEERAFLVRHHDYDFGEVLSCLTHPLHGAFDRLAREDQARLCESCGVDYNLPPHERMAALFQNIGQVRASRMLKLSPDLFDCVDKYREVILLVRQFYGELRENPRKDTRFPSVKLRKFLLESGVLTS